MMDTEAALTVDTQEKLETFLRQHRELVALGYWSQDIEWVQFTEASGITLVKFKEAHHE